MVCVDLIFFSSCGYSSKNLLERITEEDISYVENFIATELEQRLLEKCKRLNIHLSNCDRSQFFGIYVQNPADFKFNQVDKSIIEKIRDELKNFQLSNPTNENIIHEMKIIKKSCFWFADNNESDAHKQTNQIKAPNASQNLLTKMLEIAKKKFV